jgi:ubiquinone/menaquinone biosynthesis C-methylase UbiE
VDDFLEVKMKTAENGVLDGVFDRVAKVYDIGGIEFFKPVARRLVEHVGVGVGQRVLDVGCGRGAVLFPLAAAVGATGSVVGIDLSSAMVAATSAEITDLGLDNVSVLKMDGQNPEFAPGNFDVITGSMSIMMISDLATAFGNYARLLRQGGKLGMTIPIPPTDLTRWTLGPFEVAGLVKEIDPAAVVADESLAKFFRGEFYPSPTSCADQLRAEGFAQVDEYKEKLRIVAAGAAELVAWTQSHSMRVVWEAIPESRRGKVEVETIAEVTERNGGPGQVTADLQISYLVASI